jgi:hypothetical protein
MKTDLYNEDGACRRTASGSDSLHQVIKLDQRHDPQVITLKYDLPEFQSGCGDPPKTAPVSAAISSPVKTFGTSSSSSPAHPPDWPVSYSGAQRRRSRRIPIVTDCPRLGLIHVAVSVSVPTAPMAQGVDHATKKTCWECRRCGRRKITIGDMGSDLQSLPGTGMSGMSSL